MDCIEKLVYQNKSFSIHNIDKLKISHLPYSLKVLLENVLRTNNQALPNNVIESFIKWDGSIKDQTELSFLPSRVIMQDFTGVPAIVDLASMRDAVKELGGDPASINPQCQTDLIIDHSVMVDHFGSDKAKDLNTELEYKRNLERYRLLKWGQSSFKNLRIVPPNNGIIHQINIEHISQVIFNNSNALFPDTVVGTDSHTTMVNGLGVLGWGVGGIEAEAAMLGQPIPMLLPEVIGFRLTGKLQKTITATDLVLTIVEILRKKNVVGKFVEFYGDGLQNLSIADRCTIANMAPEYGATCGYFPIDSLTLDYLKITGKSQSHIEIVEKYAKEVGLYRREEDKIIYTDCIDLDISKINACISGPKRPQDRINLTDVKGLVNGEINKQTNGASSENTLIDNGAILIAAITSCTNTSNPNVIIGAGLLAKNAVEKGLKVPDWVKTSLAPGSKVVTNYLKKSGLLKYFNLLGFNIVGYGCTTCIGNSGPLKKEYVEAIENNNLVVSSILSGNRNFEGRIHPEIKMNFLASPILVIAYSLLGRINIDITSESLGKDKDGNNVYLDDIWPDSDQIRSIIEETITSDMFENSYKTLFEGDNKWKDININESDYFNWEEKSTYIQPSPFFKNIQNNKKKFDAITNAYPLVVLGDSVTTDHISPAGSFKKDSPAGSFLVDRGFHEVDFNSYGSRRGNYQIMERGTFANVRLSNRLVPEKTGGYTVYIPNNKVMTIYDAAQEYKKNNNNLIIFAGQDYGCGSSRDWAAKGTKLLGVRAVIAESFERIHRSNLVGMGVLPLQFLENENFDSLNLDIKSVFTIDKINVNDSRVKINTTVNDKPKTFIVKIRIDSPMEWKYYESEGILNYVLKNLAS
ncbi:MAG: aconitate hydratase AcnA [Pseudomonadota bacterium]|nr:aconitate hydratase AcnA [Pseudomonadota bacterium]|tara:strand:+ start:1519 stop:4107 length:2589 start_codon:yes stop_codon:yes gene_type:complete